MVYLIFDLDNTVWNKRALDNKTYELVSEAVFGRTISMIRHPVTGEEDYEFPRHSNAEIWRYKLEQILDAGEELRFHNEPLPRLPPPHFFASLVSALGQQGVNYVQRNLIFDQDIMLYLSPETMGEIAQYTSAVAVASSGSRLLQNHILAHFNYYSTEKRTRVNPFLCSFAENGDTKAKLIRESIHKYYQVLETYPSQVVYVGDSSQDMGAINICKGVHTRRGISYKAVGVLTGADSQEQLLRAGADMVLPSLGDMESIRKLKAMLRQLQESEIQR